MVGVCSLPREDGPRYEQESFAPRMSGDERPRLEISRAGPFCCSRIGGQGYGWSACPGSTGRIWTSADTLIFLFSPSSVRVGQYDTLTSTT